MKTIIVYLSIILLITGCEKKYNKSIVHHEEALRCLHSDSLNHAIIEIDKAIKLDSVNLDFYLTKVDILIKIQKFEESIDILEGLLMNEQGKDTINFMLGKTLFKYGQMKQRNDQPEDSQFYKDAINRFNLAINENPLLYDAYIGKYKALHNLNRYDAALTLLLSTKSIFPDSIELTCYAGVEKVFLGDYKSALIDLNNYIENKNTNNKTLALAYRFRGQLNRDLNNDNEAIADFSKSIEINPAKAYTYKNRGDLYRKLGQKAKACDDYRRAAELGYIAVYKTIREYCN